MQLNVQRKGSRGFPSQLRELLLDGKGGRGFGQTSSGSFLLYPSDAKSLAILSNAYIISK